MPNVGASCKPSTASQALDDELSRELARVKKDPRRLKSLRPFQAELEPKPEQRPPPKPKRKLSRGLEPDNGLPGVEEPDFSAEPKRTVRLGGNKAARVEESALGQLDKKAEAAMLDDMRGKNGVPKGADEGQWTEDAKASRKRRIVRDLAKDTDIPEDLINEMVKGWSVTSNKTIPAAQVQARIDAIFEGTVPDPWQAKLLDDAVKTEQDRYARTGVVPNKSLPHMAEFDKDAGRFVRHSRLPEKYKTPEEAVDAVLLGMYDEQQKVFKDAGVTHVHVYRGVDSRGKDIRAQGELKEPGGSLANMEKRLETMGVDIEKRWADLEASSLQGAKYSDAAAKIRVQTDKRFELEDEVLLRRQSPGYYEGEYGGNPASSWSIQRKTALGAFGKGHNGALYEGTFPIDRVITSARTGFGCSQEWEMVLAGTHDDTLAVDFKVRKVDRATYQDTIDAIMRDTKQAEEQMKDTRELLSDYEQKRDDFLSGIADAGEKAPPSWKHEATNYENRARGQRRKIADYQARIEKNNAEVEAVRAKIAKLKARPRRRRR